MVLQVEGLTKSYGQRVAVDGVSFTIEIGEVVGFLGPNGAGKTTTMCMIAGYLEPDAGLAKVFGIDVAQAFGHAGRTRVLEQFSWSKIADQTVALYAELLA